MSLIKGQLANKILAKAGMGHEHASSIRHQIKTHAKDEHESTHLIHTYEKVLRGEAVDKHELEHALDTLKDKRFKISHVGGVKLQHFTGAHTLIHQSEHEVKEEIHELQRERRHEGELEEQQRLEKRERERAEQRAKMSVLSGEKAEETHVPHHDHHEGTPLPGHIGGKVA